MQRPLVHSLLSLVLATLLLGCSKPPAPAPKEAAKEQPTETTSSPPSPPRDDFIGSEACSECHAEIADSYADHPMARSITPVDIESTEQRLGPEGTVVLPGEKRFYTLDVHDGKFWHSEQMVDASGQLIYKQSVPVDYVVGSGQRAFAYLCSRDNLLFMSPINWYAPNEQYDFAPGHSAEDSRRFGRRVADDCLSCHAGRVNELARNTNRYNERPFHHMAIGCENCHGPGEAHTLAQQAKATNSATSVDDHIVNPANLDHQRSEAVCYQCHLHAPARLLRPGRSHFDFRPGDRIDDIWTMVLMDTDDRTDRKLEPVNQVQQMLSSKCYLASNGKLGCTSCHDPHSVPTPEERTAFFRDACLNCHQVDSCAAPQEQRQTVDDSCFQCHMPARNTERISHISQTDHRILRDPAERPLAIDTVAATGPEGNELPPLKFLWDTKDRLPQWEQDRALGMALWLISSGGNSRPPLKIIEYLAPVFEQHPEDGATASVLGAFWNQYQSPQRAKFYLEAALNDPAVRESALNGLLNAYYVSAEWEQAMQVSDQLLEIDPLNPRVHALRADIFSQFQQMDKATTAAEQALQLDPTLVPVRQWLSQLYERLDQAEKAQPHREVLRRMETANYTAPQR